MTMNIDLKYIKEMAVKKDKENVRFRSFLKFCDTPEEEIDAIVHDVYREVSETIDCTACGNCCKEIKPLLDEDDVSTVSKGLGITNQEFKNKYLVASDDRSDGKEWMFNALPCPFLKENKCSCYEYRPKDCAEYPHLDKNEFTHRLWGVLGNYEVCPIVFNVYEKLKKIITR